MRSSAFLAVRHEPDAGHGRAVFEASVTGRCWQLVDVDERRVLDLAQQAGLPVPVARILAARGVDAENAAVYLNPTLRDTLPDPSALRDMDAGADRLARAVVDGETIAIFADYDVDGATSAAVLGRFLSAVGRPPSLYVPDRLTEGYGPSPGAMRTLAGEGASVVITVDCGTAAHDALAAAAAAGLDVIVVDHHAPDHQLPDAAALINPKRADDAGGCPYLAAVGVAFLLAVAVNRNLRERGHYGAAEPDLRQWLDLVALGTICDCVPLVGVNRTLVTQGLKVMGRWTNPGLRALAESAGLNGAPTADHGGFALGPRINAAGRVGEAGLGARLLMTESPQEAAEMAQRLERSNRARRSIESDVYDSAGAMAGEPAEDAPLVFVAGDGWHPGVVGIVASRLVERFLRPAVVIALQNGVGVGSGRSVIGVDLGCAVIAARESGLLQRGGGHAMAAGFTVDRERLGDLRAFLEDRLAAERGAAAPPLIVDGLLRTGGDAIAVADAVEQVGPFGSGNPEPRFAITDVRIANWSVLRGGHVRCSLVDAWGQRIEAMAFRSEDTPLGRALTQAEGLPLHVAGRLRRNTYRGRSRLQILVDDVAESKPRPA